MPDTLVDPVLVSGITTVVQLIVIGLAGAVMKMAAEVPSLVIPSRR